MCVCVCVCVTVDMFQVWDLGLQRQVGVSKPEWGLRDFVLLDDVVMGVAAQIFPGELTNIRSCFACDVAHLPQSVCAKDDAR